jgi:predicted AlkP superfamily phosphohydrolase/phosphomutase
MLRTVVPPITATAWSSFLTGMNPGKHGLYDFTARRADSYSTYLVNSSHRDGPSLWRLLSQAGHRVIVYNVPITYPPEQVNGLMVSGLLTPSGARDATWPPKLQQELERTIPGFDFSPPGMHSRGKELEFIRSVRDLNQTTLQATHYLMKRQPWDFLISVFMGTDIMSHFMWKHMETGGTSAPGPIREVLANAIQDCYRDVDAALAELLQAVGEDTYVILMSDHGFGRMYGYISVNAWLADRGYLKFKPSFPARLRYAMHRLGMTPLNVYGLLLALGLGDTMRNISRKNIGSGKDINRFFLSFSDVDWSRTRAYSNGYGGPIFVNLKGREPQGIVSPGNEYDAVLADIVADLERLEEPGTGLPFVGEIQLGSSIYSGPHLGRAPDLVFFPRDHRYAGLGMTEFPSKRWLTSSPDRSGHHRMDGILFMSGPGIRPGYKISGASIMDIAPTVLALMGVPIPELMDGRVLEAAMTFELVDQLAVIYDRGGKIGSEQRHRFEISDEEDQLLRERLRNLGYIG